MMQGTYGDAEFPMQKSMKVVALVALAIGCLLTFAAAPAQAQAAAPNCPPGQPSGRVPGQPPSNPPADARPQYPPGRCQLALSKSAGDRGDTFTASGSGFVPGETVTLSIAGQNVRSVTADPDGAFVADLTVPRNAPIGPTEVRAAGQGQTLTAAFEVTGSAPAAVASSGRSTSGSTLARTGAEIAATTALGLLLIALGAVALRAARERSVTA
jgi:hypothetical protein